jgi:hypothetical protein
VSDAKAAASYRVGVDIGGTFTDLILVETTSGAITVGKALTTPVDPSEAVEAVLRDALTMPGAAAERRVLATDLRPPHLDDAITREVGLDGAPDVLDRIVRGQTRGRTIVRVGG